jgi:hypothetical protein
MKSTLEGAKLSGLKLCLAYVDQGIWYPAMMGDFCWVLQKEDDSPHARIKEKINLFCIGLYWYLIVLSLLTIFNRIIIGF